MDMWDEMEKNFSNPKMLAHMTKEQIDEAREHLEKGLIEVCPKGKYYPVIEYESEDDISLEFHTRKFLDSKPVHHGNGSIGFIIRPDTPKGFLGTKLKAAIIQEPVLGNTYIIEAELFQYHKTVTPKDVILLEVETHKEISKRISSETVVYDVNPKLSRRHDLETYSIEVAGIKKELPIIRINDNLSIASFVIIGDTEIICACAKELINKLPEVDILITAEAKGISLTFEISRLLNMKKFIVARKSIKPYMKSPVIDEAVSITTQKKQILVLDEQDALELKGKRVAIIDDVISTGESLSAVERLVESAGGIVTAKAAILAEGKAADRDDIIFLGKLPIFEDD